MALTKLQALIDSGELTAQDLAALEQSPAGRRLLQVAADTPAIDVAQDVEARFRVLADTAPVLVWQTDEAGAVYMNQAYCDFTGMPLPALLGMGWTAALHPEDGPVYLDAYLAAFARRERFEAQFRFRRADGEYRWLKSVGLPHVHEGRFIGYIGSSFDITDIKGAEQALQERERWFAAVADASPGILWVTDASGHCTYLSRRWYEITGQTPAEGLGTGWLMATHPGDIAMTEAAFRAALHARGPFHFEYRLRTVDGRYHWCIDQGAPRFDAQGRFLGHVGQVIDISERKEAELALMKASAALEEANQRKDQFIATLAHELRNPLAPIQTGIHLVRRAPGTPMSERALQVMERQLAAIVRLIDDLMDVSRISSGRVELQQETLDLVGVVERARETVQALFEAHGQPLRLSLPAQPVWVRGDPVRLAQVFTNLLTNASRYSQEAREVVVILSCESAAQQAEVSVRDQGVGIPPDRLDAVFEMFSPLDRELGRASKGLGIGLSLALKLVEMHGGRLTAWSEGADCGATFTVELPLAVPPDEALRAQARPVVGPVKPRRILVVDDNVDAAQALAVALSLGEHQVRTAHTGHDGLTAARQEPPELVFLDIGLPDVSGYDVAAQMRAMAALEGVRLVALSGWGTPEDKRKAEEAGFDAHLTKPATSEQIDALLERFFAA